MINIQGDISIGTRALFINEEGEIIGRVSNKLTYDKILEKANSKNYRYISLGSSSRFALKDKSIFGFYGLRKFYHLLNKDEGVLTFYSIYKDHPKSKKFTDEGFKAYVQAARYLESEGIFPEIVDVCKVELNMVIRNSDSNRQTLVIKTVANGLITKRLEVPQYRLDIKNDIHLTVLKKVWEKKKIRPFHWNGEVMRSLYGNEFLISNPLFNKQEYNSFCNKINSIYIIEKDRFFKVSVGKWPPETKYGDVVYCSKNKKWYFGDLE